MIKRVVVLPDIHCPTEDKKSVKAVLQFIKDFKPHELIILGDFVDNYSISSHNKGKPGLVIGHDVKQEYDACNALLDTIQDVHKGKIVYLEGNHEFRSVRRAQENPELKDILDIEKSLRLEERKIKYVLCYTKGEVYKIGKAYFTHGLYTNDHHAKKHASNFGTNIFYGHTHDVQAFSLTQRGKDRTVVGQSLGCLCEEQGYMQGRPSKWQQAFGVFYFFPNGFFTYYVPRIFQHRFISPYGRQYRG